MKEKPTPEQVAAYYAQTSKPPKPTPTLQTFECECGKEHMVGYVCMMLGDQDIVRS